MIPVKLDENLGLAAIALLRHAGYSAERVYDEGLSGAPDSAVWQRVCQEGRLFITLDLDFSDIRRFPPGTHPGILLLRAKDHSRAAVLRVLERVVREHPPSPLHPHPSFPSPL
ncbi:MAG: DUF5615 family PIN-like protein [Candidatus Bipolaricaulia bacterium]